MKIADLYCILIRLDTIQDDPQPCFSPGYLRSQVFVKVEEPDNMGTSAVVRHIYLPNFTFADFNGVPIRRCASMYGTLEEAKRVLAIVRQGLRGKAKIMKYETGMVTRKVRKKSKPQPKYAERSIEPHL